MSECRYESSEDPSEGESHAGQSLSPPVVCLPSSTRDLVAASCPGPCVASCMREPVVAGPSARCTSVSTAVVAVVLVGVAGVAAVVTRQVLGVDHAAEVAGPAARDTANCP